MTIIEALKKNDIRVTNRATKWMVWDIDRWVVYERPIRSRNSIIRFEGKSEDEAIEYLLMKN